MSGAIQALEFVISADTSNFKKSFDVLEEYIDTASGNMKKRLLDKDKAKLGKHGIVSAMFFGVDGAAGLRDAGVRAIDAISKGMLSVAAKGGAVGLAIQGVVSLGSAFVDTLGEIDAVRLKLGATREELFGITNDLTTAGMKYGGSLGKLNNILSIVAMGSKRTSKDVAELSGQVALLSRATGTDEHTQAKLATDLGDKLSLSTENVFKLENALRVVGATGRASMGEIAQAIGPSLENLQRMSKALSPEERMGLVNSFGAILTIAKELKGSDGLQGVSDAMARLSSGDMTDALALRFQSAGQDLEKFFLNLDNELSNYQGDLARKQAQHLLGMNESTLQAMEGVSKRYREKQKLGMQEMAKSMGQITEELNKQLSPIQRIEQAWGRITAVLDKFFTILAKGNDGPMAKLAGYTEGAADRFVNLAQAVEGGSAKDVAKSAWSLNYGAAKMSMRATGPMTGGITWMGADLLDWMFGDSADKPVEKKAGGGFIGGPSGIDRVPMMGTAGEFVVNAADARKHASLLTAINEGSYSDVTGGPGMSLLVSTVHAAADAIVHAIEAQTQRLLIAGFGSGTQARGGSGGRHGGADAVVTDMMRGVL